MAGRFIVRTVRWKSACFSLGSLSFVAIGLWLAGVWGSSTLGSVEQAVGWICIVFFGLCAAIWLRRSLRPGVLYSFDSSGIFDASMKSFVRWDQIRSAAIYTTRSGRWPVYFYQNSLVYDIDPERFEPPTKSLLWLQDLNFGYTKHSNALKHSGTDRDLASLVHGFNRHAPPKLRVELD